MNEFQYEIKEVNNGRTPMTNHKNVILQDTNYTNLNEPPQTKYQYGVGYILYILKKRRPNISNPVHELSKTMDK